jgi:hypothetical protein
MISLAPESLQRLTLKEFKQNPTTTSTGTSPGKKSIIWDSLWSLDMSLERGKAAKKP